MRFFFFLAAFLAFAPASYAACIAGGCSGQLCVSDKAGDSGGVSTCEWRDEYGCYQQFGECTTLEDGKCGWKQTAKLKECLKNPNKFQRR